MGVRIPLITSARSSEGVRNLTSITWESERESAHEYVSGALLMPFTIGMAVR